MNIAIWILAGSLVGWFACTQLNFNKERGMVVSMIIGAIGGFFGGNILAPLFVEPGAVAAEFSAITLVFAALCAAVCLVVGDQLQKRLGV